MNPIDLMSKIIEKAFTQAGFAEKDELTREQGEHLVALTADIVMNVYNGSPEVTHAGFMALAYVTGLTSKARGLPC